METFKYRLIIITLKWRYNLMKWIKKVTKNGSSYQFIIPIDLAHHLKIDETKEIEIRDDTGKHGNFGCFWVVNDDSKTTE